jgi:hypothetical protein
LEVIRRSREIAPNSQSSKVDLLFTMAHAGKRFPVTAELKSRNGSRFAEVLVTGTVAHPKYPELPAVLPLMLLRDFPLRLLDAQSAGRGFGFTEHDEGEIEHLTCSLLSEFILNMQLKGGVPRLQDGPTSGDSVTKEQNQQLELEAKYHDDGQRKRISSRLAAQRFTRAVGYLHFQESGIKNDLRSPDNRFTHLELTTSAYFNLLKAIGHLDVRDAVQSMLLNDEDFWTQGIRGMGVNEFPGHPGGPMRAQEIYVQTLVTRLSRKGLIISSNRDWQSD